MHRLFVFLLLLLPLNALGESLGTGAEHLVYNLTDPNTVHVVKFERARSELSLRMGFAQGKRNYSALETVRTIASRYDVPPSSDVIAAVNGSFFGTAPDITGVL